MELEEYTPEEFVVKYGDFLTATPYWSTLTIITVWNNVATCKERLIIRSIVPFIFHNGSYKTHGVVQGWWQSFRYVVYKYYGTNHKDDGPAMLLWWNNGLLQQERWYINGKLHRVNGPAISGWNYEGVLDEVKWYLDGVEIPTPLTKAAKV
tara:strand:+ start:14233 stop:14685 length:453 start_codon:yes stop_codon:yes gene_type:complete